MPAWLALALVVAAAPGSVYDFEWRVSGTVSRMEGRAVRTIQDALSGRGSLTLSRMGDGVLAFEFTSPQGSGGGVIDRKTVESVTFPTPPAIGFPPLPPHGQGGQFIYDGNPEDPTRFQIRWVDTFFCRTAPRACGGITAWERAFVGTATRVRHETRRR